MNSTRKPHYVSVSHLLTSLRREFAATRTGVTLDSASDVTSVFSPATANSSIPASTSQNVHRSHGRLSPVSEHTGHMQKQINRTEDGSRTKRIDGPSRSRNNSAPNIGQPSTSHPVPTSEKLFVRKKVQPIKPLKSSLSAMLASSGSSSNPFAEMYANISGRGESASTNVQVYFLHATQPHGKAMELNVRRDATVEEVIGFALWSYWEEAWLPKLDEGLSGEDDPKWATRLSAIGWILRIAEDDGEVDDDFPRMLQICMPSIKNIDGFLFAAPDRMEKVTKFSEAYAILEATPAQGVFNVHIELSYRH